MIDFLANRFSKLFHRRASIGDGRALAAFIDGNSAFVAQSALYGYIKTRAGLQYFRLFDDADFAAPICTAACRKKTRRWASLCPLAPMPLCHHTARRPTPAGNFG